MTGIDSPYEASENIDLALCDVEGPVNDMTEQITAMLSKRGSFV
jgi:adenylylsulfate kinase-like enzyme